MTDVKKILVLGGNGYVGQQICQDAIKENMDVTCISRKGKPEITENWTSKVTWIKGSALDKSLFDCKIKSYDAVIHCIGVLFELPFLQRCASGSKAGGKESTYVMQNRDTALVPLEAIACDMTQQKLKEPKPFVFISAVSGFFFFRRYISTKREVEAKMEQYHKEKKIRSIIFRPGIIYDKTPITKYFVGLFFLQCYRVDQFFKRHTGFSAHIKKPTALKMMSQSILTSLKDPTISGAFDTEQMEQLLSKKSK